MGACVSHHHHHHHHNSNIKGSSMKPQQVILFDTNTNINKDDDHQKVVFDSNNTYSNGKHITLVMDGHVAVKPQLPSSQSQSTVSEYGSKEEMFFDSQAWLESDCEDDFMSVNGEFTPSRGSTPVHSSLIQVTKTQPSPTPTEKKKTLLDLFKESLRNNKLGFVEPLNQDDEMGSNKDGLKPKSQRHVGSRHGCFSTLLSVRSTGRQKKSGPISNPVVGS